VTFEFDRDVSLTPGAAGAYGAELSEGWRIAAGINGGFLMALTGVAAVSEVGGDPIALSAHYLSAATAGPAVLNARVLRRGGLSTVAVDLLQDGALRMTALVTCGTVPQAGESDRVTAEPITLPPPEECLPSSGSPTEVLEMVPMLGKVELLMPPDGVGWATGAPTGRGELLAYYRLRDGREPDPISLLQVLDTLPPVTFDLGMPGWAPTVQLSAYIRARPAPGMLRVRHRSSALIGGTFEEDCDVWDSTGQLVGQARQLARAPRL
jgi:hypothetical protein